MKQTLTCLAALALTLPLAGARAQTLADALDTTNLVWTTGGDADWFGQGTTTHDGVDAAQSGDVTDNQSCWLETTVTGPVLLTFWWKVSSEQDYDWLEFHVDGARQARISGEVSWQSYTTFIAEGIHTCRWQYLKDGSASEGQDAGWVDQVQLRPYVTVPLAEALDTTNLVWTTGGDGNWFGQPATTHDGVDAAQSGGITNSQSTWLETTVNGPGLLSFWWKVSSEEGYDGLELYVDGVWQAWISGEVDWRSFALPLPEGAHTCRWQYLKDESDTEGQDRGWVDQVQVSTLISLAEALDATNLVWTTGGDVNWFGQSAITHDGVDAAQTGFIEDDESTWLETTVTGPGMLSFWWKVSSERRYDWLEFYVDGVQKDRISGDVDWQFYSLLIPEGTHTCRWQYLKDGSASEGQDAGWVDQVQFTAFVPLAEALDTTNLVWATGGDANWFGQSLTTHDGADAAQSPSLLHNDAAWATTTVIGPGLLTFWWKVSSQTNSDFLSFLVNGLPLGDISGEVDWRQESVALPAGTNALEWYYWKDGSDAAGADAGWLDQVAFTETTGPAIVVVADPKNQHAMVGDVARFDVTALGAEPFAYQWQYEGADLPGATNQWLRLQPVQPEQAGDYRVAITNVFGAVTSAPATLALLPYAVQWQTSLGGSGWEVIWVRCQTEDGGFLVGGSSTSTNGHRAGPHYGGVDYWVTRLDADGNLLWERSYGGTGNDYLQAMAPAADGGFLLAGSSTSGPNGSKTSTNWGNYDFWIVRIDSAGHQLWDHSFGGNASDDLWAAKALPDGGFVLAGPSASGASGNKTSPNLGLFDFWLVRVDANGNWMWDKSFGGADTDAAFALDVVGDTGFLLAGSSASQPSGNKTSPCFGQEDFWLVRTDSDGNKLWDAAFGGSQYDAAYALQPAAGGGWLIGGESVSGPDGNKTSPAHGFADFWVVRVNAAGQKVFDQSFGGSGDDILYGLEPTRDGAFLLAGESDSEADGTKTRAGFGGFDCWLVCMDANGQQVWDYTFGGADGDWAATLCATADGGFLVGAASASAPGGNKTSPWFGQDDFWLIKIQPYQAAVAPRLTAARTANNTVVVSWPMAGAEGWVLQSTTNLVSGGSGWAEIPPPYQTNGANLQFTEPTPIGNKFFRLRKP